ncbi:hypothetical protein BY458DRAFT_515163 [Sporodiniella umbellata]|nr:hypothetical protein BY458DRAFT_515163 [Sporodiniella umbellata]
MDQEDIWAESDEEQTSFHEKHLAEREWVKMQEDHGNSGYKEGVVEGKEVNMQRGFDQGYQEGVLIGKALGQLRGRVSSQWVFYQQILKNETGAKELETLLQEIDAIEVGSVFCIDYFRSQGVKSENYVSPKEFIHRLQSKVDQKLLSVSQRC